MKFKELILDTTLEKTAYTGSIFCFTSVFFFYYIEKTVYARRFYLLLYYIPLITFWLSHLNIKMLVQVQNSTETVVYIEHHG